MNHSNLFAQRKAEPYFLFYGKADVLMGLCAPAIIAAHAPLEGRAADNRLIAVPGQLIEMPGIFQLVGRIGQCREGHAVTCKADARNAAGDSYTVHAGAAVAILRVDRAVLGKICPNVVIPCTHLNTDLANDESTIWILEDPEGFEQAYGALSEKLGADWAGQLIDWDEQLVLSALNLGSYNTTPDGSQRIAVQSCFAGCKIAIFDREDRLWRSLNS